MTIVPIKVEKATTTNYKFIEWMLHNVCNYDCSFCEDTNKNGSIRWNTLDKYKLYVDKLINVCNGKTVWFQFTGGEPTLFPELLELLEYIKSKGAYISLISNGSRTIRWWQELKEKQCLDYLFITCHTEQIESVDHIIKVLDLFHNEQIQTTCMITHTINSIEKALTFRKLLEEKTGTVILFKAMMIVDYDIYSLYTTEQSKEIMKSLSYGKNFSTKVKPKYPDSHRFTSNIKVTYNDNSTKILDPQVIFKTKQNNFKNWKCAVGIDTMRIVGNNIYRGVCGMGDVQYSLDDDFKFSDDFIVCNTDRCFCATDLITTKIK